MLHLDGSFIRALNPQSDDNKPVPLDSEKWPIADH